MANEKKEKPVKAPKEKMTKAPVDEKKKAAREAYLAEKKEIARQRKKARDMAEIFVGKINAECSDLNNASKQYLCGQAYLKFRELAWDDKTPAE